MFAHYFLVLYKLSNFESLHELPWENGAPALIWAKEKVCLLFKNISISNFIPPTVAGSVQWRVVETSRRGSSRAPAASASARAQPVRPHRYHYFAEYPLLPNNGSFEICFLEGWVRSSTLSLIMLYNVWVFSDSKCFLSRGLFVCNYYRYLYLCIYIYFIYNYIRFYQSRKHFDTSFP